MGGGVREWLLKCHGLLDKEHQLEDKITAKCEANR